MHFSVVCIARALGSQGEEIARLVAERAGFKYVDEEVVRHAAELGSVDMDEVHNAEKRKSLVKKLADGAVGGTYQATESFGGLGYSFTKHADSKSSASDEELRQLIRDAIDRIAEAGSAVIVAHAASYALRDRASALRVLVTGSKTSRTERVAAGGAGSAAAVQVVESDLSRADYLKRFYNIQEELPWHYDLTINTDRVTVEEAADLILGLVDSRQPATK